MARLHARFRPPGMLPGPRKYVLSEIVKFYRTYFKIHREIFLGPSNSFWGWNREEGGPPDVLRCARLLEGGRVEVVGPGHGR
jgi:hypothetical protein